MPQQPTKQESSSGAKSSMTKDDAARIQSTQAKNDRDTGKGSFASRAQSAADKNANTNSSGAGKKSSQ